MSERARLWGLRLLAVAMALATWYFASLEKRERPSERVVDATVTYLPARGLIILDPIQTVKVRLRGSDRRIRALNPFLVDVVIDLQRAQTGPVDFHLGEENVLRPDDVEVVSIEPNTVRLQLDREGTRVLPVEVRLTGEAAAGAVPAGPPAVDPESVLVSGPESRLRALPSVAAAPVSLDGHAFDFVEIVMVLSPDPLVKIVQPAVVSVRVELQRPEEQPVPEPTPRRRRP